MKKRTKNLSPNVWLRDGDEFYYKSRQTNDGEFLENGVYELFRTPFDFGLRKLSDSFEFDYKIYGLETGLIERAVKYYQRTTSGNLGVLLNGLKGTGKTVTGKIIANKLNQPIILIPENFDGGVDFVNSLPQNLTVFVDEYEKTFEESFELLTIMDGTMSSSFRRVFILTMNELSIDRNLIDRPTRIRYRKHFGNLKPEVVEEIVDDLLENPEHKNDCVHYLSTIEIVTVDIVKAVLHEVNIHDEPPTKFKDMFNVTVLSGKYKVGLLTDLDVLKEVADGVKVWPVPDYDEDRVGRSFQINGHNIGNIVDVLGSNKLMVKLANFIEKPEDEEAVVFSNPYHLPTDGGEYVFDVSPDYSYNSSYKYYGGNYNRKLKVPIGEETEERCDF